MLNRWWKRNILLTSSHSASIRRVDSSDWKKIDERNVFNSNFYGFRPFLSTNFISFLCCFELQFLQLSSWWCICSFNFFWSRHPEIDNRVQKNIIKNLISYKKNHYPRWKCWYKRNWKLLSADKNFHKNRHLLSKISCSYWHGKMRGKGR